MATYPRRGHRSPQTLSVSTDESSRCGRRIVQSGSWGSSRRRLRAIAAPETRSLGYAHADGWLKTILPQVYPQIRLPIYAVLAFSLSVVDVALIVGPDNPPPLAVLALRGFTDPDVGHWFPASAAACLLFALVVISIVGWRSLERRVAALGTRWLERGRRGHLSTAFSVAASVIALAALVLSVIAIVALGLWSFVAEWRFPAAWPASLTLANWTTHLRDVGTSAVATLVIGVAATAIALLLTLGCLEDESRRGMHTSRAVQWLIYLPLLVPQIAFLFGIPPLDPITFAGTIVLFAAIGLAACYGPAKRATRIEPTTALRCE